MEILKQGNKGKQRKKKHFKCKRCGCEFVADDTEFKYPDQMELMHDGIKSKCKCPTCGAMVYKH